MKKFLLLGLLALTGNYAYSQCGACTINTGCTISPAAPQLCPAVLPDGTVGVAYDQDATFYMPAVFNTSGVDVTLNQITVTNITGIPQGLSFTCSAPNCVYFPSQNPPATERGCVKICGVPTIPGNYNVVVSVVAQVSTPLGPVTQPESFTIPLRINPPPGGNASFSFNPPGGCDSVCVTFEALIEDPVKPTTWNWTFDNGNTSTLKNPPVQCFNTPGEHFITLETKTFDYVLSSVTFTATTNQWCGDVEEIEFFGVCQGAPDIFFDYANGSDAFTTNWVGNNTTATFSNLNRVLQTPTFALTFWDDDDVSQNDNLGTFAANVTGTGTINFTTPHGFGSAVITSQVDETYSDTDTIFVYTPPAAPVVTNVTQLDSICTGDTVMLVSSIATGFQWYNDTTLITGAENDTLFVTESGNYWVRINDANGCLNNNQDSVTTIAVINFPPTVGLFYTNQGSTINTTTISPLFTYQWFYSQVPNSGGLPIPGQTGTSISPTLNGYYYLVVYNLLDCASYSDTVNFVKNGLSDILSNVTDLNIYPNPSNGQFTVAMGLNGNENTAIIVRNVVGQTVLNIDLGKQTGKFVRVIDSALAKGMYIVEIARPSGSVTRKLVIE